MGPRWYGCALSLLLVCGATWAGAQVSGVPASDKVPDPTLVHRPAPKQPSSVRPEGHLSLDVLVNDGGGKPAMGLQPWDFKLLDNDKPAKSSINPVMGNEGALERTQISVHQLANIAENEARQPGRKLLVWVGPGWPMLQSQNFRFSEQDRRRYFDVIVELTNRLREARIVVNSVAPADSSMGGGPGRSQLYKAFLKSVTTERQADVGNLGLKVPVSNTGGRILGPDNDLTAQINQCIADANAFYRLSFDPPAAEHADEYHDLKVQVNQPGLTVRTNAAYYNQPPGN